MRKYIIVLVIDIFFLIGIFSHLTEVIAQENSSFPVIEIEWLYSVPGSIAEIPIKFTQGLDDGQDGGPDDITAINFTIDYDQENLVFDPTDGNVDGIPDSITFNMPSSFSSGVILTGNPNGEISISIVDFFPPLVLLPSTDGIVKIGFELMDEVVYPISICPVNASFSDSLANSIPGEEICGGIGCSTDLDCDGVPNDGDNNGTPGDNPCTGGQTENCDDNCRKKPNGPDGGTCTWGEYYGEFCNIPGENTSECGINGFCSMDQEDTYPPQGNGCGDACECEGDFEPDGDVDGTDALNFKADFYRNDCSELNPCNGDFNCDGDVDGTDTLMFKADFFRKDCPSCGGWPCGYE